MQDENLLAAYPLTRPIFLSIVCASLDEIWKTVIFVVLITRYINERERVKLAALLPSLPPLSLSLSLSLIHIYARLQGDIRDETQLSGL